MAKFDIVGERDCRCGEAADIWPEGREQANDEPDRPRAGLPTDSIRIRGARGALKPIRWGGQPQVGTVIALACFLAVISPASAEPIAIAPDAPARTQPAPAAPLPPSWDLDGLYLWLGPTGAAGFEASQWDSTFGGDATVIRIREHEPLGAIGATLGASRWTERGGGRVWLDGLIGTPALGRMFGASLGPLVELSDIHHPRVGGSVGLWAFVGITPYARFGVVDGLGGFAELGIHIALPVIRKRR
jgi:hypothetical protein